MSDTPRTDAKEHYYSAEGLRSAPVVFADFARELERDLIAAQGYRAAAEEIAARRGEMVDALIAERDEARRKWCELASAFSASIITAEGLAKERGWDCFEKEAKP
jgi:hypothetical protein